jgi:tetratricopeptide (TPR) repeat protein
VRALTAVLREAAPEGAGLAELLSRGHSEARELALELAGWQAGGPGGAARRGGRRPLAIAGVVLGVAALLALVSSIRGGNREGGTSSVEAAPDTGNGGAKSPQERLAELRGAVERAEGAMNEAARQGPDVAGATRVGVALSVLETRAALEPLLAETVLASEVHLLRARASDVAGDDDAAMRDALSAVREDVLNQAALVFLCRLCARAAFLREEGPRGEKLLLHPVTEGALVIRAIARPPGPRPGWDVAALGPANPVVTLARVSGRLADLDSPASRETETWLQIVLGNSPKATAALASATAGANPDLAWARAVVSTEPAEKRSAALDAAIAASPADPLYLFTRARVRWSAGDSRGALQDLDLLLALRPSCHDARLERASCRFLMGDVIAAEADLDTLPSDPLIAAASRVLVATQLRNTSRHLEAMRACEEVLRRLPDHIPAQIVYSETCVDAGDEHLQLEAARRLVELAPWNPEAMSVRARLLHFSARLAAAQDGVEEAHALSPSHPVPLADRSMLLAWVDRGNEALEDARLAVELAPLNARARLALVSIYEHLHDRDGELREIRRGLELQPGNYQLWVRLGDRLNRLGDFDGTIRAADRAQVLSPGSVDSRMLRACVYSAMEKHEEAAAEMDSLVAEFPDRPDIRGTRARVRLMNGDQAGAFEDAWRAVELAPQWYEGYLVRGVVRKARGDEKAAREDFEKARNLAPRSADARSALGQSYLEGGDPARAKPELERALVLDPFLATAWVALGEVRLGEGDKAGARQAFRKALETIRPTQDGVVERANAGLAAAGD